MNWDRCVAALLVMLGLLRAPEETRPTTRPTRRRICTRGAVTVAEEEEVEA
jgi:hypothetical protein